MTHEFGFLHMERRSQDLNIHDGIKVSIYEQILVLLHAEIMHPGRSVIGGHEFEHVGSLLDGRYNRLCVCTGGRRDGDRGQPTSQDIDCKHIQHYVVLIVSRTAVHGIDNL